MDWRIPLSTIDFGPEELTAVNNVIHSKWLTMGSVTQEFESAFAKFTGAEFALAVTNATAALHMACMAIGLKPGDEAIFDIRCFRQLDSLHGRHTCICRYSQRPGS
jgi:dTDP-4-amino-4,6-dideoxygalactose transaminase